MDADPLRLDSYPPQVRKLIDFGDALLTVEPETWPFYPARLKLTAEHVPALIAVVNDWRSFRAFGQAAVDEQVRAAVAAGEDEADAKEAAAYPKRAYGFVHAWRALGQLQAVEAVGPLLAALRDLQTYLPDQDDEWSLEEMPFVLPMFGPPAVDPVGRFLADAAANDWARTAAVQALVHLGREHPDARPACVDALAAGIDRHADQSPRLNASFVAGLMDLDAVEAAASIRAAYAADRVDGSICGGWRDVREELNIGPHPDDPPEVSVREYQQRYSPELAKMSDMIARLAERGIDPEQVTLPGSAPHPVGAARDRKRKERKKARQQKKRNRRK